MKKKNILGIILGIISIISSFLFCGINGLVLGWIIGFSIGTIGLIISLHQKNKYNARLSNILCIIGMVAAILNLVLGLITKYGK